MVRKFRDHLIPSRLNAANLHRPVAWDSFCLCEGTVQHLVPPNVRNYPLRLSRKGTTRFGGQSGTVRLDTAGAAAIFAPMSVIRDPRRLSRVDLSFRPFEPCFPRPAKEPPAGAGWIHEIKHDGFRIIARRKANAVRFFTRNGYDFTARFPKIVVAAAGLPVRSCVIDGEAIVVDENGLSVFDALRHRLHDHAAILCAFDVIELDGKDIRWACLEDRKHALADLSGTDVRALRERPTGQDWALSRWLRRTRSCGRYCDSNSASQVSRA